MGILIVLGFAAIIVEMIRRGLSGVSEAPRPITTIAPSDLGLAGADRIAQMVAVGGRLAILVDRADAGQVLILVDPARLTVDHGAEQ